jgi:hypothetical protein
MSDDEDKARKAIIAKIGGLTGFIWVLHLVDSGNRWRLAIIPPSGGDAVFCYADRADPEAIDMLALKLMAFV